MTTLIWLAWRFALGSATVDNLDFRLAERWLTGWSLARGLPLPRRDGGGLIVDVGWPGQLRRHVCIEAGTVAE